MRLYVDTADAETIARAQATGFVYGVTTNPALLRRAGRRRPELALLVQTAAAAGLQEVHVQVFADDTDGIIADAREFHRLDPRHVVVKVPATAAGFRAAAQLAGERMPVTMTAVYAVRQVILSDLVGARYAAAYLGRMRDAGQDAFAIIRDMLTTIRAQRMDLRLLVASVRAIEEVEMLAQLGVPGATLPPELLFALPEAAGTAAALQDFREDIQHL